MLVGCQSIGLSRLSNSSEGLNFHLRMTVQMMPAPIMQAATTAIETTVFRAIWLCELLLEAPLLSAAAVELSAADEELVDVTVTTASDVALDAMGVVATDVEL